LSLLGWNVVSGTPDIIDSAFAKARKKIWNEESIDGIEGIWLTERVESSMNIRLGGSVRMQIDYTYNNLKIISRTAAEK
jgi:hypothetical protein